MSAPDPAPRRQAAVWVVFLVAWGVHAWCVTRNWTTPFMMGHEFRQTQTAINTYYIDQQDNFSLLYETPIVGKPWVSILMEVPIYEWSVVGLSRATGLTHQVAARTVTLACFYLTLPAFYLLLGCLGVERIRRLPALALTLLCPVYIFYSRAFLMDSMTLLGSAWFLYGYLRMMEERRWYWFVLATAAGTLAALVKSATLAIWLWPAAAYAAWQLWRNWRARAGWAALAGTGFWALAGVIVPLGLLKLWIQLTDPLKAAHASAWIFTSENLAGGNWGLNDMGARFSPRLWQTLADRWGEAVMPPWLLLVLLVAGAAGLPKVRWPALALAGVFFWAQILFPYAYAYQDYYFYSCAVFVTAGLGLLLAGLLDSRLSRWLCWLLFALPFAAQLTTYVRGYYYYQSLQSEGGFPFTRAMRDFLPKESVIIVAGDDWSGIVPYYSQHKTLMVRNGLENDTAYLDRAFADLADEEISALVLMGAQRGNRTLVDRAAATFQLDVRPTFVGPQAEVYGSLRYRDHLKEGIKAADGYGDLVIEPGPASAPRPATPFPVSPGLARIAFPNISPAPARAYFAQGLSPVWVDGEKMIFAHPEANLWLHAPAATTRIEWDFGIVPDAYERAGSKTDGVEFTITGVKPGGERREIFKRLLDPVNRPPDRGKQKEVISYRPVPGEFLLFTTKPGDGTAFDWAYWARVDVR